MKILLRVIITELLRTLQNPFGRRLVFSDGSVKATFSIYLGIANPKLRWFPWVKPAHLGKIYFLLSHLYYC